MKKLLSIVFLLISLFILSGCQKDKFDDTKEINIYTRDITSGTRDGFFTKIGFSEAVKDNEVLAKGYIEVAGNGELINAVNNDEYGIGYISLSSLESSGLKGLSFNRVLPTEQNVINGTYTLTRNFNYIIRKDFESEKDEQIVKAFIAYMNTIDGKATIKNKDGIVKIKNTDKSWEEEKKNHPICNEDNSNITIIFGGSTSVEKIAKALSAEFSKLCGNFKFEHNHTGSGDAFKRTQGSQSAGGNKLHIGFASREFKTEESVNSETIGLVCIDGIVVVVNKNNSILTDVTKEVLLNIYNGHYKTWNSLKESSNP